VPAAQMHRRQSQKRVTLRPAPSPSQPTVVSTIRLLRTRVTRMSRIRQILTVSGHSHESGTPRCSAPETRFGRRRKPATWPLRIPPMHYHEETLQPNMSSWFPARDDVKFSSKELLLFSAKDLVANDAARLTIKQLASLPTASDGMWRLAADRLRRADIRLKACFQSSLAYGAQSIRTPGRSHTYS